jgi:catechol 2,3-dioxygenase-like lactoylglutathione lyase family enzyme
MNFPVRQVPAGDEVFLDHVGWMTSDMDRASEVFERLGFVLTPYSVHGSRDPETGKRQIQGSANRLAMLRWGYLEILAAVPGADTAVSRNIEDSLDRYEGVHLVAASVADADADFARLEGAGVALQPLVHLRRDVEAADGSQAEVAFSVIRPAFGAYPEGRLQLLTHHTPEHMWQERHIAWDNGLDGLAEVLICSEDPAATIERLGGLMRSAGHEDDAGSAIDLSRGRVRAVTPDGLARLIPGATPPALPFIAGIGFRSRDIGYSRAFFEGRGITLHELPTGGFAVDAADALGCYLLIGE